MHESAPLSREEIKIIAQYKTNAFSGAYAYLMFSGFVFAAFITLGIVLLHNGPGFFVNIFAILDFIIFALSVGLLIAGIRLYKRTKLEFSATIADSPKYIYSGFLKRVALIGKQHLEYEFADTSIMTQVMIIHASGTASSEAESIEGLIMTSVKLHIFPLSTDVDLLLKVEYEVAKHDENKSLISDNDRQTWKTSKLYQYKITAVTTITESFIVRVYKSRSQYIYVPWYRIGNGEFIRCDTDATDLLPGDNIMITYLMKSDGTKGQMVDVVKL